MILDILGATLKSRKETGDNNFNNTFYLTQYTQNTINSTCAQHFKNEIFYILSFIQSLQNLVRFLYLHRIPFGPAPSRVPGSLTWPVAAWGTASLGSWSELRDHVFLVRKVLPSLPHSWIHLRCRFSSVCPSKERFIVALLSRFPTVIRDLWDRGCRPTRLQLWHHTPRCLEVMWTRWKFSWAWIWTRQAESHGSRGRGCSVRPATQPLPQTHLCCLF